MEKVKDPYVVRGNRVDRWLIWNGDGYSKKAKTAHEFFEEEYSEYKEDVEWREWKKEFLTHLQDVLIQRYIDEGFWLIALGERGKTPIDKWSFEENRLDRRNAMRWMLSGHNIGVVCGSLSKGLMGIDFDTRDIPEPFTELINETLTTESIRGYHLFFRSHRKKLPDGFVGILKDEYNVEFRYEMQYFLLPLSIHPSSTKKDIKFYDFVDWTAPILNIKDLMGVI